MPRTLPLPKGNEMLWRDLLPPEHLRQHGRHIYMFRNTQTNQILYTLYPRIEQRTLKQLPFIGKHSVPPRIRPDLWTAHCRVGPFPTKQQGLNAFKKLRELRKLHELCWNKNNPEWAKLPKKSLIQKIMDQKNNAAADLAHVLKIQASMGKEMDKLSRDREVKQQAYLDKRWAGLKAASDSFQSGRIEVLENKIRDSKAALENNMHDDKETHRLNIVIREAYREIKYTRWAHSVVRKKENAEKGIDAVFKKQTEQFEKESQAGSSKDALEPPTKPENWVRKTLLPKTLQPLPAPFSLEGVEAHWADPYDAEYALDAWPQDFPHGTLNSLTNMYREGNVLTEDEYKQMMADQKAEVKKEMMIALEDLVIKAETDAENERRAAQGLPPVAARENMLLRDEEPEPEVKGWAKYVPSWMPNPFKRKSA